MQPNRPIGVQHPGALSADVAAAVRTLAASVQSEVGQPPLSDQALTQLTSAAVEHFVVYDDGHVIGYAQRDADVAEILARDDFAAEALLGQLQQSATDLTVWSHGSRSRLEPVLAQAGFTAVRTLHQMRMPVPTAAIEVPPLADGVTLRTFVVGQDEDAVVRVNAAAFATHPEQGSWTRAEFEAREAEDWFEAAGVFLAEREGQLIGFHWTKRHDDGNGEVYVIGVDPGAQGLGLGKLLLLTGLRYLQDAGCPEVLLYVDDSNSSARQLYRHQGFTDYDRDIQWRLG